ncbi:MAG: AAA family ATPase [Lachnospiraceae bacterium]
MDKKIPLGMSSFSKIILEGYYYVDKTKYIRIIEDFNTKYPVLLRPRRFGKTLFADMLQNYYDVKEKDNFNELFGNTYIGENKTQLANSYYVLHLNLSGLDTRNSDRLETTFDLYIKSEIKNFIKYYEIKDIELSDVEDFVSYTHSFLTQLRGLGDVKLYIIIDEYDHFANSLLSSQNQFKAATNKDGFVRNFYEVLKKHTNYILDRIFITGVTSLTLDSLTSGFNICTNISNVKAMNGVMGFTQSEVVDMLDYMHIPDGEATLKILKDNYNGYLFSENSQERIYNSNMILYYLDSYLSNERQPTQLADPNITGDYTKLASMLDLYTDSVQKDNVLQNLMSNESVIGKLVTSFSLLAQFTYDHFLSLLYYLGLLTIEKGLPGGRFQFITPNNVIRDIYYDYYFVYLTSTFSVTESMIINSLTMFGENEDVNPLIEIVEQIISESTEDNNRYMIHFRENTLQTLFYLMLRKSNLYNVSMEYQVNKRFIDILCTPIQASKTPFVMEFKYLSQLRNSGDDDLLNNVVKEVQEQIREDINLIKNAKGAAIVFLGKKCTFKEIV